MKRTTLIVLLFAISLLMASEPFPIVIEWEEMFPEAAAELPHFSSVVLNYTLMWDETANTGRLTHGKITQNSFNISWTVVTPNL